MKISSYLLREAGIEERRLYETIFDLGVIATVGDMMPLKGENRVMVKLGLQSMNRITENCIENHLIGKILARMAHINYMSPYSVDKAITEEALAYYVCPVLNATGRVDGNVNFIVDDLLKAYSSDFELYGYKEKNKERKKKTKEISEKHRQNNNSVDITVLEEKDFNYPINGLIGLLANRISNSEHKPCFVGYIPKSDNICKFSGRTVNGYSIYDAFQRIKTEHPELNLTGGGHEGALGIEMPVSSIDAFEKIICEDYDKFDGSEMLPNVYILDPADVDEMVAAHSKMAPYGEGFKQLKFMTTGTIENRDETTNLLVVNGFEFKVYTALKPEWVRGTPVNVYFSISLNNKILAEFKVEEIEVLE